MPLPNELATFYVAILTNNGKIVRLSGFSNSVSRLFNYFPFKRQIIENENLSY